MIAVMPMAGRGSRFADIGIATPKPLIDIRGRPMYSWAMDSLPLGLVEKVVFVCLREHLDQCNLQEDIETRYADLNPVIIGLDEVTEGQACTVLVARDHIDNDKPLLIYNADTYCRTNLEQTLPTLQAKADGLLSVFQAPGAKWSFARTNDEGRVVETAEKKRISQWACTGLYHFSRGSDFVRHADEMIAENQRTNKEFYVAPLYNRLIADGADIRIDEALEVWVLGTPEDLEHFNKNYKP